MKLLLSIPCFVAGLCLAADERPLPPRNLRIEEVKQRVRGALVFENPQGVPGDYKLVYQQNFEHSGALVNFVFSDPKVWRVAETSTNSSLELFGKSDYQPKHRSPFNIALIKDKLFGDFVMDVDLQSTVKPYGHQDMCLFFGFESTNRFYYVHLAVAPDPHAHNTFIVNDAPRLAIAKQTSRGVTWGENQWHRARLERKTPDGTIKVYFDDFETPIMVAEDKTFGKGYIGFGSFDDMGRIDNIRIYAPSMETKPVRFFQPANIR